MDKPLLVSKILHPLIAVPVLALVLLNFSGLKFIDAIFWVSVWVTIALVPTAVAVFFTGERRFNIKSGPERRKAFLVGITSMVVSLATCWFLSAPEQVLELGAVGVLSAVLFGAANYFDKVSVHTGALTGAAAAFSSISLVFSGLLGFLALLVGWSRLELDVHSRAQTLGGGALGLFCGLVLLVL